MKGKLLVLGLLAGSSLFAGTRVFVGVGGYAPPPVVAYAAPLLARRLLAPPRYRVERHDFRGERRR